jgi:hypothetical protein
MKYVLILEKFHKIISLLSKTEERGASKEEAASALRVAKKLIKEENIKRSDLKNKVSEEVLDEIFGKDNSEYPENHIIISGVKYKIEIEHNNIDQGVLKYLHQPTSLVFLDWDSRVEKVRHNVKLSNVHISWFEPIDKGKPSIIICDDDGDPVFSVVIYKDSSTLSLYDKNEPYQFY